MMFDVRTLAVALRGEVSGRNTVLVPGPGHSHRDRSLSVRIDPSAPDGFLTFSHAGDDWKACRDHVRGRLGLPPWQPGDDQNRTIPARRVPEWDLTAIESEVSEGARPRTEEDLLRIKLAKSIWDR